MKKLFEKWNSISLILRIVCGLTIGVLTWGVIIGVGMRAANDTTKKVLDDISNGLSQVVSWIISMAPFGILGLVFSSISSNGLSTGRFHAVYLLCDQPVHRVSGASARTRTR